MASINVVAMSKVKASTYLNVLNTLDVQILIDVHFFSFQSLLIKHAIFGRFTDKTYQSFQRFRS